MHEVGAKLYVPNAFDLTQGLGSVFGATIMIINGGLECTTDDQVESSNASLRANHYSHFLSYFGLPEETGLGCATMQAFSDSSSSNYPMSLDRNWATVDECKVAPWFTGFSIFRATDYKRCVCYYFEPEDAECMNGDISHSSSPKVDQE